jgi:hypothetical protein
MTPRVIRFNGGRRIAVLATAVALIGSLFAPSAALATGPWVNFGLAPGQQSPTNVSPINLTVTFSDPVEGFTGSDLQLWGSAGGTWIRTVTGGPKVYNVAITGMTTSGVIYGRVPAGVAYNPADEPNSESNVLGGVGWAPGPTVSIQRGISQATPTGTSPVNWSVTFQDPVEGFTAGDVVVTGTAGGTKTATVTGGPKVYNVAVTGMTTGGEMNINVPEGSASNPAGEGNGAGYGYIGSVIQWAPGGPTVTVNQAAGQVDPAGTSPIKFAVVFSEPVTGFTAGDVTIDGTAGGTKVVGLTGSGATYTASVTGMTTAGTVIATVAADVAVTTAQIGNPGDPLGDASVRPNKASTSTDNTVTWSPVAGALTLTTSAPIPPGAKDPVILWGQGFTLGVQFGAGGANRTLQLQGTRDGAAWTTITTLTTDANGRAALDYRPVTNLFYRAVFAGAPDLAAVTSNQVRTVVRGLAVMRPTNGGSTRAVARNSSITFSTTVRPARPELPPSTVSFFFYRQVSGTWQLATRRDVLATSAGLATTTFTFGAAGQWYVRSQAGPTPYNANSVLTPIERYSVR